MKITDYMYIIQNKLPAYSDPTTMFVIDFIWVKKKNYILTVFKLIYKIKYYFWIPILQQLLFFLCNFMYY